MLYHQGRPILIFFTIAATHPSLIRKLPSPQLLLLPPAQASLYFYCFRQNARVGLILGLSIPGTGHARMKRLDMTWSLMVDFLRLLFLFLVGLLARAKEASLYIPCSWTFFAIDCMHLRQQSNHSTFFKAHLDRQIETENLRKPIGNQLID